MPYKHIHKDDPVRIMHTRRALKGSRRSAEWLSKRGCVPAQAAYMATKLYYLPDRELDDAASELSHAVQVAGYGPTARTYIGERALWGLTVAEFFAELQTASEKGKR